MGKARSLQTVELITRDAYQEIRELNYRFQRKISAMKDFKWDTWEYLPKEIKHEHISWNSYLIISEDFNFSPEIRNNHAIDIKKGAGWVMGDVRDYENKIDPFLTKTPPEWFWHWAKAKDVLLVSILKQELVRKR